MYLQSARWLMTARDAILALAAAEERIRQLEARLRNSMPVSPESTRVYADAQDRSIDARRLK